MPRRLVSLLLLPCVLLSQSATLGHAHACGLDAGGDPRPHVHTAPAHDRHGHGGHHHHDDSDSEPGAPSARLADPSPDGGSDAVYLAAFDVVPDSRGVVAGADKSTSYWAALLPSPPALSPAARGGGTPSPPRLTGGSCPLYIRLLTLLI